MEEYIKKFDIHNFPGEDVTEASLHLKAIASSIGKDCLLLDIVHRVLEGFAHASTPSFQSLCHDKESMLSTLLLHTSMPHTTLYLQLISVLHDLEKKFIDLRSGHHWLGIGHGSTSTKSMFYTDTPQDNPNLLGDDQEYVAYKTTLGKHALPFEVWVRDKTCHHCGQKGNVRGEHCPTYVSYVFAGRIPLPVKTKHATRSTKLGHWPSQYDRKSTSLTSSKLSNNPTPRMLTVSTHQSGYTSDGSSSSNSKHNVPLTNDVSVVHSAFLAVLGCPKE